MFNKNNVRTFSSLITMVMAFMFLVAATPPSCSTNATISYTDNGIVKTVKLSELRAWAITEAQTQGDSRYAIRSTLNSYSTIAAADAKYATKTSTTTLATKQQLLDYVTKTQLAGNLATYAKTSDVVALDSKIKTNMSGKVDKEEVNGLKAILNSVVSAMGLNDAINSLKAMFTSEINNTKSEADSKFATKAAVEAFIAQQNATTSVIQEQVQTLAASEIEPVVETSSGVQAYEYEADPVFDPNNVQWNVDIVSKSQPTYVVRDRTAEWTYFMDQLQGGIDGNCPDLPAVNNTGKVNITLARNQVNGINLQGTHYQAVIGLVELLKHGYDDNYFGIVKLTDGRFFVGKRNGNSVEVMYLNDQSIDGSFIAAFYSRVDCIEFSSDL